MSYYILDAAGFVTGTFSGPGQPANSTNISPPADAAQPLQFVGGAWRMPGNAPAGRIITRLAFRRRFTMAEKVAIEMAALDHAEASSGARLQAATLRAFLKDADAAENITLDDETTRAGVTMLLSAGLLAKGRDVEILDAPIQDAERPN